MKMYVVMSRFDNGEKYEENVEYDNFFKGVFSKKEWATVLAKCKASEAFLSLKRYEDGDEYNCPWYVFEVRNMKMDETGMKVIFDTYNGHGYIEYYVVEVEVDQEWRPSRND